MTSQEVLTLLKIVDISRNYGGALRHVHDKAMQQLVDLKPAENPGPLPPITGKLEIVEEPDVMERKL